jgi:hypothetical protein
MSFPFCPDTKTTPYGSSYDSTRQSPNTTLRPTWECTGSSIALRVSTRRLRLLRRLRILLRSAIAADFFRSFVQSRTLFFPTRRASSSTRSPGGLCCHSTSNPELARHDSPCFRRAGIAVGISLMPSLSVASMAHRFVSQGPRFLVSYMSNNGFRCGFARVQRPLTCLDNARPKQGHD